MLRNCRLDHLSVCDRKVYCGKTADWIRMPFGMVRGVGLGMGVLDFGGDRRRGMGSFGGKFGVFHCNQWGLCDALFPNYFEDLLYCSCGFSSYCSRRVFSSAVLSLNLFQKHFRNSDKTR